MEDLMSHELKWLKSCDLLSRIFSTCSKRQYFSVIVADNKRILSQGYNGSPPGYPHCDQGNCARAIENSPSGSNYDNCVANHAEANALLWCDPHQRQGATLIINGTPCLSCAKLISGSGIRRVVGYEDNTYAEIELVKSFLDANNIELMLIERKPRYDNPENAYMKKLNQAQESNKQYPIQSGTQSKTYYP